MSIRSTGAIFAAVFSVTAASAQSDAIDQWFKIPEDQAGLAVYFNWSNQPPELSVSDAKSTELDTVNWDIGLPLVRQYRVKPGAYEVRINGIAEPKTLELKPGELAYLRLDEIDDTNKVKVAYQTGSAAAPTRSQAAEVLTDLSYKQDFKKIQPVRLDTTGYRLYFNTEPPFDIPKPDDPEPQPEPKPDPKPAE